MLSWLLAHLAYTIIDGLADSKKDADLAVILGSKVNEDGSLSKRLENRLECGLGLYREGRVKSCWSAAGSEKKAFMKATE